MFKKLLPKYLFSWLQNTCRLLCERLTFYKSFFFSNISFKLQIIHRNNTRKILFILKVWYSKSCKTLNLIKFPMENSGNDILQEFWNKISRRNINHWIYFNISRTCFQRNEASIIFSLVFVYLYTLSATWNINNSKIIAKHKISLINFLYRYKYLLKVIKLIIKCLTKQ